MPQADLDVGDRGHGGKLEGDPAPADGGPVAGLGEHFRRHLGDDRGAEMRRHQRPGVELRGQVEQPGAVVHGVEPWLLGHRHRAEPVTGGLDLLDPDAVIGQQAAQLGVGEPVALDGAPVGTGQYRDAIEPGARRRRDHLLQRQVGHRHVAQHQFVTEPAPSSCHAFHGCGDSRPDSRHHLGREQLKGLTPPVVVELDDELVDAPIDVASQGSGDLVWRAYDRSRPTWPRSGPRCPARPGAARRLDGTIPTTNCSATRAWPASPRSSSKRSSPVGGQFHQSAKRATNGMVSVGPTHRSGSGCDPAPAGPPDPVRHLVVLAPVLEGVPLPHQLEDLEGLPQSC